ncbi:MAG: sigma 54-interacting transcriptional regulator [Terriglobia bacterium]|jgi:transcriptional regulator with GAF, ATPase, and Fis domain|nr:sigma 54-interacting transcriptional regulator [Terriglobia bacterium]
MITSTGSLFPEPPTILVASSNDNFRRQVINDLQTDARLIGEAVGGADALSKLETGACQVLFLDRCLWDLDAEELKELINSRFPAVEVVPLDSANQSAAAGWSKSHRDVGGAPWIVNDPEESDGALPGVIGNSPQMQRVVSLVRLVARKNTSVLLTGETGTGKEVIARAIHESSARASRPLVIVNCAAIPEALLEAELFGHTRGAFTGAVQSRVGRVQAAQGGTLLLDEIGDMPIGLQAKLLRFLENGEVQRLGSSESLHVDVRVVASTNANLTLRVAEKLFREDLYYRLSVFPIELPPLRERGGDAVLLAKYFLRRFCGANARLGGEAMRWIAEQPWRGNVRELRHCMERASILWDEKSEVGVAELNPRGF